MQVVKQVFIWIVALVIDLSTLPTRRSAQLDIHLSFGSLERGLVLDFPQGNVSTQTPGRHIAEDPELGG
jgi:hypothetical protein